MKATLILENGMVFHGTSMGATADCICEMVFNTSMVGYQEILTDPSYAGQGVVMTYPLIGNYGVNKEDEESRNPWAAAMIVRRLSPRGSNFRNEGTLDDYLKRNRITGICGVDTRAITRLLRDQGTMNGMITVEENPDVEAKLKLIRAYRVQGTVEKTSRSQMEIYPGSGPRVALLDLGVKENMIRCLQKRGCEVTVFPADTPAEVILEGKFDGLMLSNGPGDPADNVQIIAEPQEASTHSDMPGACGICLGTSADGAGHRCDQDREAEIRPSRRQPSRCGISTQGRSVHHQPRTTAMRSRQRRVDPEIADGQPCQRQRRHR